MIDNKNDFRVMVISRGRACPKKRRGCNQHLFLQFGNKKPKTPLSHDRCQEFFEKAKKNDQNGMESIERSARAFFSSNGTRKRFFCFC